MDGSWSHVGFSSSFGVVYALSVDTGRMIDYETHYRICAQCSKWDPKDVDTDQYKAWYASHEEHCSKDHISPK